MSVNWTKTEDEAGHPTLEFVIERDGKRPVTGALWLPDEVKGKTLVLFGHGASGDRYQTPISHLAGRFQRDGIASLSIDGPVHGLRKVGDGARGAFSAELQRPTHVPDMIDDWSLAVDLVLGREDIKVDGLAYFGLSMGSIYGIPLVASRADFKVASLGLVGMMAEIPGGEEFLAAAKEIDIPLLFLMQLEDELFPREGCYAVFDAFASEDKRMHCNPGLHPEIPAEEIDFSYEFMLSHIDGRAKRRIVNPLAE